MRFFALFLALAAVGNGLDLNKIQNDAQGMAEKLAKDVNVGASDLGGLMKEAEDQVNKLTKDLPKGPMEKPMEKPKMVKGKPSKFAKPSPQDFQKMMKEKFEAKRKEMAKTNTDMIQKFQKLAKEKGLAKTQAAVAKFEKFDFSKLQIVMKKKNGTDEEIEDFDDTMVDGAMDAIKAVDLEEMDTGKVLFTKNDEISRKLISSFGSSRKIMTGMKCKGSKEEGNLKCKKAKELYDQATDKIKEMKMKIDQMKKMKVEDARKIKPERLQMMKKLHDQIRAVENEEAANNGTRKELAKKLKAKMSPIRENYKKMDVEKLKKMEEKIKAKKLGQKSEEMMEKFKKANFMNIKLDKAKPIGQRLNKTVLKAAREAIKSVDWPKMKEHKMLFTADDEVSTKIIATFDESREMVRELECDLAAEERTEECDEAVTLYEDSKEGVEELKAEIDVMMEADPETMTEDDAERLQIAARMADEISTIETIEAFEPDDEGAADSSAKSLFSSAILALLFSMLVM